MEVRFLSKEEELLNLIKNMQLMTASYVERINKLRAEIAAKCSHSTTMSYTWEHDDGYGRQKMCEGRRCILCLKISYWEPYNIWD